MKLHYLAVSILFAMLIFFTGCARRPLADTDSRDFQPVVMVPKGVTNAETDPAVQKDSAVIVSIPESKQYYVLGETYPIDQVGEKVSRLQAAEPQENRIVYLAAGQFLDYGEVANVVGVLREAGVDRLGLLVEPPPGAGARNIFRVQIPPEPNPNEDLGKAKPNPLTLVVSIANDLKLKLNQEAMGTAGEPGKLTQKLTDIFQQRKEEHAYKPGMETRTDVSEDERVEKTIVVKAQRSTRYAEVVRLIDAVKGAGANPIVLQIDDLSE